MLPIGDEEFNLVIEKCTVEAFADVREGCSPGLKLSRSHQIFNEYPIGNPVLCAIAVSVPRASGPSVITTDENAFAFHISNPANAVDSYFTFFRYLEGFVANQDVLQGVIEVFDFLRKVDADVVFIRDLAVVLLQRGSFTDKVGIDSGDAHVVLSVLVVATEDEPISLGGVFGDGAALEAGAGFGRRGGGGVAVASERQEEPGAYRAQNGGEEQSQDDRDNCRRGHRCGRCYYLFADGLAGLAGGRAIDFSHFIYSFVSWLLRDLVWPGRAPQAIDEKIIYSLRSSPILIGGP